MRPGGARATRPSAGLATSDEANGPPYPSVADTAGVLLDALFLDALEADVERITQINQTIALLAPDLLATHVTPLVHVDVLVLRPSIDRAELVLSTVQYFPAMVRHLFRGLGASDDAG